MIERGDELPLVAGQPAWNIKNKKIAIPRMMVGRVESVANDLAAVRADDGELYFIDLGAVPTDERETKAKPKPKPAPTPLPSSGMPDPEAMAAIRMAELRCKRGGDDGVIARFARGLRTGFVLVSVCYTGLSIVAILWASCAG